MRSPKTYVILLLAVTTIGGVLLAWRQWGELVELRAATMNKDERADLQKRVWDLEKRNRELQDRLAANRDPGTDADPLAAGTEPERPAGDRRERGGPPGGRGDSRDRFSSGLQQATAIRELMNKPEVQAMLNLQRKAEIEQRYSTLFKNLNLPPEQIDKLKSLLAERSTTLQDVVAAASEQGVNPRQNPESFRQMMADAQNEINKSIKATIGDSGFAQLSSYEQTLPQRNVVNELQQRLSYTSTPLTTAQAEQMVSILAANAPPRPATPAGNAPQPGQPSPGGRDAGRGPGGFGPPPPGIFDIRGSDLGGMIVGAMGGGGPGMGVFMGGDAGRGSGTAPVTPAAVSQAQTVLAPPQVAALQQIQQQQQTQQQLRKLVNDTLSANQPQPPPGSSKSSGGSAGGANPPRKRGPGGE